MGGRIEREGRAIRVAIVEPYRMARAALGALLERADGTRVVGAAPACPDALAACAEPPDVLVLSVDAVADLDALAASREAARPRVIVLGSEQPDCLAKCAAGAGASGFVCKREPADTLLRAIERVHDGEVWFDGATMATLIAEAAGLRPQEASGRAERAVAALSAREREIVGGVTAGLTNRELAVRCGVTEGAVRHALTRIYRALGVKNRLELARLDLEVGIGTRAGGASEA